MRYAILSDIHSNLEALNAVIDRIRVEDVDDFICVGDIVGYNANPAECIGIVRSLSPTIIVRGNHDEYIGNDADLSFFNMCARESALWTRTQLTKSERSW